MFSGFDTGQLTYFSAWRMLQLLGEVENQNGDA
jgi:hypothetical protein